MKFNADCETFRCLFWGNKPTNIFRPRDVFKFETFRFESLNLKLVNSDPLVIEQRRGLKQDAHMRPLK